MCLGFGLFVALFLYVFEPFGLSAFREQLPRIVLWYGVICSGVMLVLNIGLYYLFPGYFNEKGWTTGKQIFWSLVNIAFIALCNLIYTAEFSGIHLQSSSFLHFFGYTLALGFFPVILVTLWYERLESSKYKAPIEILTEQAEWKEPLLNFPTDNQNEALALNHADFLFALSADNYVEVHYRKDGAIHRIVLRTNLKQLEEAFQSYPMLQRVHRSALVNLENVSEIQGNAQGYKLRYDGVEEPVRVSRSFDLKTALANRSLRS